MRISDWSSDVCSSDLSNDPPSHTRYRKLVDRAFTAGRVRQMEDYMVVVVRELIDAFIEKGRLSVMQDFAVPVPMYVIADQLGVPRSHRDRSEEHTSELQSLMRNSYAVFCLNKKTQQKT